MFQRLLSRKFVQDTLVIQVSRGMATGLAFLSSLVVWRVMTPSEFGVYAQAHSFFFLWTQLDLTGASAAMYTRLGIALGAKDDSAALDAIAGYARLGILTIFGITVLIILLGIPISGAVYGSSRIGVLAVVLSTAYAADVVYGFIVTALSASRQMRWFAALAVINQVVLSVCWIGAVLLIPAAEALVIGRLIYSTLTLIIALVIYHRAYANTHLPALRQITARVRTVEWSGFWRFGFANALDKNLSSLFVQIPLQLAGIIGGSAAAGYMSLALSGIANAGVLTSAVFENVQAIVPQAVGRGEFRRLRRNMLRVIVILVGGAVAVYGALAIVAPFLIPPILGSEWIPAVRPLEILTLYGALTAVGGVFGPLYRAFRRMRAALAIKITTLVFVLPIGAAVVFWLTSQAGTLYAFWGTYSLTDTLAAHAAAAGGAALIVVVFTYSVTATALVMLPELRRRAALEEKQQRTAAVE